MQLLFKKQAFSVAFANIDCKHRHEFTNFWCSWHNSFSVSYMSCCFHCVGISVTSDMLRLCWMWSKPC